MTPAKASFFGVVLLSALDAEQGDDAEEKEDAADGNPLDDVRGPLADLEKGIE